MKGSKKSILIILAVLLLALVIIFASSDDLQGRFNFMPQFESGDTSRWGTPNVDSGDTIETFR